MKVYVKRGKTKHFYDFSRLNWELVCVHNAVPQNYKTELEKTLVTSDPLWNTVVTTEEESGGFLFRKNLLQSQVLSTSLSASESYCIFLQLAVLMIALRRLLSHFQIFVS